MEDQLKKLIDELGIENVENAIYQLKEQNKKTNKEQHSKEFVVDVFNKIQIVVNLKNINHISYKNKDMGIVFEQDWDTEQLWIHQEIWDKIQKDNKFSYKETQDFFKKTFEEIFRWTNLTPRCSDFKTK
ncbi:MAG: hypothetical protein WC466_06315 [Candidatus Izemoplasmatales bacterium]